MGGFIVEHGGKLHTIPFDKYPNVESVNGRLPDHPVLVMDEDKFARSIRKYAIWCQGKGEFALLSYCGNELTITQWDTLEKAVQSKHMIVQIDPMNSREAKHRRLIAEYIETTL